MAVVFITRMEGDKSVNEGLCLKCAKELNIKPVTDLMDKMGITDEQLDAMDDQMNGLLDSFGDSFDMGGAQSMPFMQMFNMTAQRGEEDEEEDGEYPQDELADGQMEPYESGEEQESQMGGARNLSAKERRQQEKANRKTLLRGGLSCGLALGLASGLQQVGIQYTTVGKAGFITACYIVIVPLLGLFFGKKCSPLIWGAVVMAVVGLYMLCMTGGSGGINRGDLLMLVCAGLFSVHILVIDYFSPMADGVKLSCIQFLVAGVLSGLFGLLFEEPKLSQLLAAWVPVLYAGVMSCGVAYTLQIVGQKPLTDEELRAVDAAVGL